MDAQTVAQASGLEQDQKQVVQIRNVQLVNTQLYPQQHQPQMDAQIVQ